MCLIAKLPEDIDFPEELLFNVYSGNNDGFGFMLFDSAKQKIRSKKFVPSKFSEVLEGYKRAKDYGKEVAIHLRYGTSGRMDTRNAHPYKVLTKSAGDEVDLYMMHNGVMSLKEYNKSMSDTWHLVNYWLRPFLREHGYKTLYDPWFNGMLGNFIGVGSKLLFLDGNGKWTMVNADKGNWDRLPGAWLSNTYTLSCRSTYSYKNWQETGEERRSYSSFDSDAYQSGVRYWRGWQPSGGNSSGPSAANDASKKENLRSGLDRTVQRGSVYDEPWDWDSASYPSALRMKSKIPDYSKLNFVFEREEGVEISMDPTIQQLTKLVDDDDHEAMLNFVIETPDMAAALLHDLLNALAEPSLTPDPDDEDEAPVSLEDDPDDVGGGEFNEHWSATQ